MTSVTGDRLESTSRRTRRLAVLPAVLGVVAMSVLLLVALVALGDEPAWPTTAVLVAVVAVGATVATGYPVGLYAGLIVYAVALIGGGLADTAAPLALASAAMVVAHELVRVSVDARRPARFGPRLWLRFAGRTVALAVAAAAVVRFAAWIVDTSLPSWLVPLGIVAAGLPLVAHRLSGPWPVVLSAVLAVLVAATAVAGALLGATARSQIERATAVTAADAGAQPDSGTTTTTAVALPTEPSTLEPLVAIVLFGATLLIVGAIIVALRRKEMVFDLDELDLELDDASLGFAGPGRADVDDDRVEIDEATIDRLLADLALDMAAQRDAGRAVRYAYANIERRLAELGVTPVESETEQEFLVRAIPTLGDDGVAMAELTDLFERARFGHVPVSEEMRAEALSAVERLRVATARPAAEDADSDEVLGR